RSIVKHMAGNMRSRWTDFLTSDGEKPDRNRDQEFELNAAATREQVMRWWEEGWKLVFDALAALKPEDVGRTVYIRGEAHTVLQAINRQVAHYAHHVGQILYVAKHIRKSEWKSLSIPKGKSAEYNLRKPESFQRLHCGRANQRSYSQLRGACRDPDEHRSLIALPPNNLFHSIFLKDVPALFHVASGQQDEIGSVQEVLIFFGELRRDH